MTVDAIDRLLRQANPIPDPMQVEPVDGSVLVDRAAGVNDDADVHQLERRLGRSRRLGRRRAGGEITDEPRPKVLWLRRNGRAAPPAEFDLGAGHLDGLEQDDAEETAVDVEPTPDARAKRRWTLVAAAAVAVLAIAASVLVVASRHDTTRTEVPVGPGPTPTTAPSALTGNVGFVGVPPEGATPSTPPTGELVAAWYVHPAVGSIFPGTRQVYADGRVLSFQVSHVSGWLEQRLTPEGVELVRSEIVSSHPDADVDLSTARGIIRVRNGGRLVLVRVGDRMLLRLAALETWLPPRVWEDRDATAYIPSTYAVCVGRAGSWEALPDPVQAVSLFPAPLPQLSGSPSFNDYPGGGQPPSDLDCWNVTTEQAREVAAAFDAAGIEPEVEDRSGWLLYRFDVPEPVSTAVDVNVWPVLPEGAFGLWGA